MISDNQGDLCIGEGSVFLVPLLPPLQGAMPTLPHMLAQDNLFTLWIYFTLHCMELEEAPIRHNYS